MNALIKKAIFLSWFTVAYNLVEGIVAIAFGIGDDSVALAGFGVDSLIEVASAILILWRFRSESGLGKISVGKERKATLGIGVLFLILAAMTAGASAFQLKAGSRPSTTFPGLAISVVSLGFMFWLWLSKRKVAQQLDSVSMLMDSQCSLACIKLSGVLFAGNFLFLAFPFLWWVDSVSAILIASLIGKEGWETLVAALRPDFSGGCGCGGRKHGCGTRQEE